MRSRFESFQRNTAFLTILLIGFACFLFVANKVKDVAIPLVWAAFFAMPLTLMISAIDANIVRCCTRLLHPCLKRQVDVVEFTGHTGDGNIRINRSREVDDFYSKLQNPCAMSCFPWCILSYCRRRVQILSVEVLDDGEDEDNEEADQAEVSEVNRIVPGWSYYAGSAAAHGISEIEMQIPLAAAETMSEGNNQIVLGLYLDQESHYPAVIADEQHGQGKPLKGTLTMNKKSSLSWIAAFIITMAMVVAWVYLFVCLISLGVRAITDNIPIYKKGIQDLVRWAKPLFPADVWNRISEKAMDFANNQLPNLATLLANEIESVGSTVVFFLIYLVFWLFEPLPISGPIMQVFKSYLVMKTCVCVLFACLMSGLLYLLGSTLWPLFLCITFILNYIPEIGAIACAFLMVPAVLLDGNQTVDNRMVNLFWLVIGGTLIKVVTGNVIEVRLYTTRGGQFMRMHPVILMAIIMLCMAVLGVTGAFLSVPIMAAVKYLLLAANMPESYLNPLLVVIEGDEMGPHRNYVDRQRSAKKGTEVNTFARLIGSVAMMSRVPSFTSVRSLQNRNSCVQERVLSMQPLERTEAEEAGGAAGP